MPSQAEEARWLICDECQNVYHQSELQGRFGRSNCSCGCPEFYREVGYVCDVCGTDFSVHGDARACELDHTDAEREEAGVA